MISEEQQEKKNKTIALVSTAAIQVVLLVALFMLVAWRPPNPPLPEYGIELNFGLDDQGYGEVQPESPVGSEEKGPSPTPEQPEEVKEEQQVPEEEEEIKPIEAPAEEPEVVTELESPVIVKEKKEVAKPPVAKPVEKVEEKKVEQKPQVDSKAVFKPKEQASTTTGGGEKAGKPGNHGDDPGTVGDKGSPEGKLDAKALYGQPGSGSGGVSMSGFNGFEWPSVQSPTLPDEAFGVYEFMVKVDDQGDVISVTPLKRGLSLEAERKLKAVIQQLVFQPKGSNLPPQSEGKITFRVVSK
ncbi:MAG: hypothetical protein WKF87_14655 [Chryseolinea sp.]